MNRALRRTLQSQMRTQAKAWPLELTEIPETEWPAGIARRPRAVWRSRGYLVQMFDEPQCRGIEVRRLSINRVTIGGDGHWEADIDWERLMRLKREAGFGDWYGVEVFPRDRDVVNDANMRHLWLLAEPLPIGWVGP